MIEAKNLSKHFGETAALDEISFKIEKGRVFGLIGSNGSGKSTLLRIISGVYRPEGGFIAVDNEEVFDNPKLKGKIFFLGDTPFFFSGSNILEMAAFYKSFYPEFSSDRLEEMCEIFSINKKAKISNMSKGMQRQVAVALAFSCRPKYLLLDEAFDGLDPVMRELLKRLISQDIEELGTTVIIASHNLRELEDMCDLVGLLHKGKIIFSGELDNIKSQVHKVQAVFKTIPETTAFGDLHILKLERTGSMLQLVIKGDYEEIESHISKMGPIFYESLSPTLEELFIFELGGLGYDVNAVIG